MPLCRSSCRYFLDQRRPWKKRPSCGRAAGCRWHRSPAQFLGGALEAGDELLDRHPVQAPCGGAVGRLLQLAQRGCAGHLTINADRRLHGHVLAQCTVIVEVFPAQRQTVHALAQHVAHAVLDEQRTARVGDAARGRLDQPELAIDRAEQHHAAVAGHAASVEAALHPTSAKTAELDGPNVNFFGTVSLGIARSRIKTRHLDKRAFKGQCRPRFHEGTVKYPG